MTAVVLGHQGGWDEILLVLLPIALFAGLLGLANRRATRQQYDQSRHEADAPASTDDE